MFYLEMDCPNTKPSINPIVLSILMWNELNNVDIMPYKWQSSLIKNLLRICKRLKDHFTPVTNRLQIIAVTNKFLIFLL